MTPDFAITKELEELKARLNTISKRIASFEEVTSNLFTIKNKQINELTLQLLKANDRISHLKDSGLDWTPTNDLVKRNCDNCTLYKTCKSPNDFPWEPTSCKDWIGK